MAALPVQLGLVLVAAVWCAGAVWSFAEQRDFAAARGFDLPALLPLTIDGLALSLAVVAWSAALDGRAAVQARLGTFVAIAASAASNATYAATRTATPEHGPDVVAVVLAGGVPLAAAVAFETLLAELRKGVHRRRGLPAPVAVAAPRLIRLVLAPWPTFRDWRAHVLHLTATPGHTPGHTPETSPETSRVSTPEVDSAEPIKVAPEAAPAAPPVAGPVGGLARKNGRPVGASPVAAQIARLAARYPTWTTAQIAQRAGCSTRTVRRHLKAATQQHTQQSSEQSSGGESTTEAVEAA